MEENNLLVEATAIVDWSVVFVWPCSGPLSTSMVPNCQAWYSVASPGTATDKGHTVGCASGKHGAARLRPAPPLPRNPLVHTGAAPPLM